MQRQTRSQKIRLRTARDSCWPVKIRVRAMPTLLASRTAPDLPASLDVSVEVAVGEGETVEASSQSTNPVPADWRLSGEQDERAEE